MSKQARHERWSAHGFVAKRRLDRNGALQRQLGFEPLESRHLLATITVTSLLDNGAGGTTLREAVAAANSGDTVVFAASLFSGGPVTIQLQDQGSGNPDHIRIQNSITVQGPGASLLTIRAYDPTPTQDNEDGARIFNVGDGNAGSLSNVTISGLTLAGGDPTLDDVDLGAGGAIRNMENLTILNCVFTDNYNINGGAIANALGSGGGGAGTLTITDSTFSGNRADDGGAVLIESGTAIITRTIFENNFATNVGGAINSRNRPLTIADSAITGNDAGNPETEFSGAGGGIAMYGSTLSITGSTISFNTAGYKGGGIFNYDSSVTITNSTISGNSADLNGGGFYSHYLSNDPVAIRHSTVTGNAVLNTGSGGGIYNATGASTPNIVHTIVAGNLRGAGTRDDADGSFNVQFSLIGDGTGATINDQGGNLLGTMALPIDPMLGPLADNGGLTFTHSPLLGSKAINAGDAAAVAGSGGISQFDQRGTPNTRVFGGRIDIGAVEFQSPVSPLSLVVDIATDEHDGNVSAGDLSLREALAIANSNFGVVDAISFAGSLSGGTLSLTLGALPISDPVTITGLGANLLTVNASTNGGNRIFNIDDNNAGTSIFVLLDGLKLSGANITGDGGAIRSTESLTLARMTISGNSATGLGGGVKNEQGNLTVTDSTVSGNNAATGGGIWSDTDLATKSTTIKNSTVSGNTATAAGGGIFNSDGLLVIEHSTITNNTAPAGAGGGVGSAGIAASRTEVLRTIISGNVNSDLDLVGGGTNSLQSNGYNLVGSTAAAMAEFVETGDLINSNPMLEALADNGGPTMTHLLMDESPARDAGGSATAGSGGVPLFDQRGTGFDRVLGSQIDIGAVELPAPITPEPELPGDYNRDEVVDAADFVMWVKTFGLTVPQYEGADGNGDTMVDDDDYPIWTENFGETLPPGAGSGSGGGTASMSASDEFQLAELGTATFTSPPRDLVVFAENDKEQHAASRRVLVQRPTSAAASSTDLLMAIQSMFATTESEASDFDDDLSTDSDDDTDSDAVDQLFGEIGEGPVPAGFGL